MHKVYLLILLSTFICCSQKGSKDLRKSSTNKDTKDYRFPDDWLGDWRGVLSIYKNGKLSTELPMRAIHSTTEDTSRYRWSIIYGEDSIKGLRDYYLLLDSIPDNRYLIDEGNSILLQGFHHHNIYTSRFNVAGNELMTIYRLQSEGEMIFEVFFSDPQHPIITGGGVVSGDTIPQVSSLEIPLYQVAKLYRR